MYIGLGCLSDSRGLPRISKILQDSINLKIFEISVENKIEDFPDIVSFMIVGVCIKFNFELVMFQV